MTFALSGTFDLGQMDARFVECSFGRYRISCDDGQSNLFYQYLDFIGSAKFSVCSFIAVVYEKYLQAKFRFGLMLQMVLTGGIALLAILLFKMPILLATTFFLGTLLGCYLLCLKYFARDYRLLLLDWTNVSQLFTRGAGSVGMIVGMMVALLLSILLLVGYGFAATMIPFWLLNGPVLLVLLIGSVLWHNYYQRKFWQLIH